MYAMMAFRLSQSATSGAFTNVHGTADKTTSFPVASLSSLVPIHLPLHPTRRHLATGGSDQVLGLGDGEGVKKGQ